MELMEIALQSCLITIEAAAAELKCGMLWLGGEKIPGSLFSLWLASKESQSHCTLQVSGLRASETISGDAVLRGKLITLWLITRLSL